MIDTPGCSERTNFKLICYDFCQDSTGSCGNQVTLAKKLSNPDTPCGNNNAYQGYCVNKCPIGFYPKSGKCLSCHDICSSCNETQCLSCKDTNYLSQHGLCVKTCDAKMLMKNSSSQRVRLVEGRSSLEGVVEVYYKGSWGTICADGWSAGEVLCKELKLGHVVEAKIVGQSRFKRSDGYKDMKIWLSGVDCKGQENSILECKHKGNLRRINMSWLIYYCDNHFNINIVIITIIILEAPSSLFIYLFSFAN